MINICVVCGQEFEAQKSTKKYCSNHCSYLAKREREKNKSSDKSKICPICKQKFVPKTASANQRMCCYECMPEGEQLTRGGFLAKMKQHKGGKCIRCGYNNCMKALEFHHKDPSQKDFTISNDHFKLLDATNEIEKCVILCSNCHKELHDNMWSLDDIIKD